MQSKEEIFKARFEAIMFDMRTVDGNPDEQIMLGSLAERIVSHAGSPSWSVFKSKLSKADYGALLASFQNQGNELARQGSHRQVHAIEVLAVSLIAKTQAQDTDILAEDVELNQMIDDAIRAYRDSRSADPVIS